MVARTRIIAKHGNKDIENIVGGIRDINIYFAGKKGYCLIYCNKVDEEVLLTVLKNAEIDAYVSNEYVDSHNF